MSGGRATVGPGVGVQSRVARFAWRRRPSGALAWRRPAVPHRGQRTLIDVACIPPGTDGLQFSSGHGVRLRWDNGQPELAPVES
jgi:hypothetical protein